MYLKKERDTKRQAKQKINSLAETNNIIIAKIMYSLVLLNIRDADRGRNIKEGPGFQVNWWRDDALKSKHVIQIEDDRVKLWKSKAKNRKIKTANVSPVEASPKAQSCGREKEQTSVNGLRPRQEWGSEEKRETNARAT
jgi:hypothetical protein